jgi:hypothetical protein
LQNDYLNNALYLSSIIEKHFDKKASLVTPEINAEKNYPWFRVSFVLYRTYQFCYEFERGYYSIYSANQEMSGICILFNDSNKKRFNNKNFDESTILENLKLLDNEIRLRLPDKFLIQFA